MEKIEEMSNSETKLFLRQWMRKVNGQMTRRRYGISLPWERGLPTHGVRHIRKSEALAELFKFPRRKRTHQKDFPIPENGVSGLHKRDLDFLNLDLDLD